MSVILDQVMALSPAERSALCKVLSQSLRKWVRPDYRRQISISVAEASDLTGLAPKTIRNALWKGRIKRGGVGRYCIDQDSVIRAFRHGGDR
jgi:hypothetical protein